MATTSYEDMANTLYECNWVDLPLELRRNIVLMITNAQRPLFYHGFHIAVLDLKTLTTVKINSLCILKFKSQLLLIQH